MNKVSTRKSGYRFYKEPWGWNIEWYDGRGTYIIYDELKWWQLPFAFVRLWIEVKRG